MKKILSRKRMIRYCQIAVVLSASIFILMIRKFTVVNIIDTLTITGVCFLTAGFAMTIRYVHFNDDQYNRGKKILKKLRRKAVEEETGIEEKYEYVQKTQREVDFVEAYLISGILLGISYVWAMLL